jgi:branched-subunit amino acid aminotransferase/4-amino-4-deoxychorismate lyase
LGKQLRFLNNQFCRHLYELDAHLDRFLRSAAKAKITPPFDRATIRDILIQTAAAGECKSGILRYWLSVGRGGFNLSALECDKSLMYAILVDENLVDDECKTGIKVCISPSPSFQLNSGPFYTKVCGCFSVFSSCSPIFTDSMYTMKLVLHWQI